jgi:hypothetical protein
LVSVRASACYPDGHDTASAVTAAERRHPVAFSSEITAVDNEGLRLGMFLGGLIMAAVPVAFGTAAIIFLFKKYREENREER